MEDLSHEFALMTTCLGFNLVKYLVEKGADVKYNNDKGRTPLMYAIQGKHMDNIKLMLEHEAETQKEDNKGRSR